MFMVRYGTGFVSDDHDGRFPELNPSLFRQASNGLDLPANTGKTADADPQRSDGSGGAADGLRGICGGIAVPLRGVCGGRDHRKPANTGETTHVDPPCFGGFRPCLLAFAKH